MMESTANYRTQPLSVYAPASVGNMSVGFDALGLALAPIDGTLLGDIVMLSPLPEGAEDWVLEVDGPFAAALPPDPVPPEIPRLLLNPLPVPAFFPQAPCDRFAA